MPANNTDVEMQPQAREEMVANPGGQSTQEQGSKETSKKPRLGLRGGGIILDLCACFICCEVCKGCCECVDDCCCC